MLVTKVISWVWMNHFCPSNVILLVWMKKHFIMTTLTPLIESITNNFVMEYFCVDSISKLLCIDSKPKCSKSTLVDYRVEFLFKYFKPKLILADFNSKFVYKPKSPTTTLEKYYSVEFIIFG
jgi:hypothetical protein